MLAQGVILPISQSSFLLVIYLYNSSGLKDSTSLVLVTILVAAVSRAKAQILKRIRKPPPKYGPISYNLPSHHLEIKGL